MTAEVTPITKRQDADPELLKLGRGAADTLLRRTRLRYFVLIETLTFYYVRKLMAMHKGDARAVASAVAANHMVIYRSLCLTPGPMPPDAQREAESWATSVAASGARYRLAQFLFIRGLIDTAVELFGSQEKAAERLGVHRRTIQNKPQTPEQCHRRPTPLRDKQESA